MKFIVFLLILLLIPFQVFCQVYDGLRNGGQMAMELIIIDTTWVNRNPKWFTGDYYNPCTAKGSLRYSLNKDTLFLTCYTLDGYNAYNTKYAQFTHSGKDLVGWHYGPENYEFRYVYLRDTTLLPIMLQIPKIIRPMIY